MARWWDALKRIFGASAQSRIGTTEIPKLIESLFGVPAVQAFVRKYVSKSNAAALKTASGWAAGPAAEALTSLLRLFFPRLSSGALNFVHDVVVDFMVKLFEQVDKMSSTQAADIENIKNAAVSEAQKAAEKKVVVVFDGRQYVVHTTNCPTPLLFEAQAREESTAGAVIASMAAGMPVALHTGPAGCSKQTEGTLAATQPSFPPDTKPSHTTLLSQISGDKNELLRRFTDLEEWFKGNELVWDPSVRRMRRLNAAERAERQTALKNYNRWCGKPNELADLLALEDIVRGATDEEKALDLSRRRTNLLRRMQEQGAGNAFLGGFYAVEDAAEEANAKNGGKKPGLLAVIFTRKPK